MALLLRHRKAGILAMAMAIALCVARVAVGTHYPGDVLAGALLGSAAALALWQPMVRRPLHALAERVGRLYDALLGRLALALEGVFSSIGRYTHTLIRGHGAGRTDDRILLWGKQPSASRPAKAAVG